MSADVNCAVVDFWSWGKLGVFGELELEVGDGARLGCCDDVRGAPWQFSVYIVRKGSSWVPRSGTS